MLGTTSKYLLSFSLYRRPDLMRPSVQPHLKPSCGGRCEEKESDFRHTRFDAGSFPVPKSHPATIGMSDSGLAERQNRESETNPLHLGVYGIMISLMERQQ